MQTTLTQPPKKQPSKLWKHERIPTFVRYYNAGGEIKEDDMI